MPKWTQYLKLHSVTQITAQTRLTVKCLHCTGEILVSTNMAVLLL